MSDSMEFCPGCGTTVSVRGEGDGRRCFECGSPIRTAVPPPLPARPRKSSSSPPWYVIMIILFGVVLGLAAVGLAILYAGCAFMMKQINH